MVPYYLVYINALLLILLWAAVGRSPLYLIAEPLLILLALYFVGYFDLSSDGRQVLGRILFANLPAALLLAAGLTFVHDGTPGWSALAALCGGILVSYLLQRILPARLGMHAQRVVIWIDEETWKQPVLLEEIAKSYGGHLSFRRLESGGEGAPAPVGERSRFPGRVYRHRRDSVGEPDGVDVVVDFRKLCETAIRRIPIELLSLYEDNGWRRRDSPVDRILVRAVDLSVSTIALVLLLPFFAAAAAAILLEDGAPIVLRQTRIGVCGKPFVLYKLRTMRQEGFNHQDPNANMGSRILRCGRLLRRSHLDETLQFFNVLNGTMSLVGARPELPVYHDRGRREIPGYGRRLYLPPGMTGWAQVRFSHTTSIDEYRMKTSYDLWYVRNRSIRLNLAILMQTVRTVIFGTGK